MTTTAVDTAVPVVLRRPLLAAWVVAGAVLGVAAVVVWTGGVDWRSAFSRAGLIAFCLLTILWLTVDALVRRRYPSQLGELPPPADRARLDVALTATRKGRPVAPPARLVPALRHELDRLRIGRTGGVQLLGVALFAAGMFVGPDPGMRVFGGVMLCVAALTAIGVVVGRTREPDLRIQSETEVRP